MPPYITNSGKIFERVSSGSFEIKDSSKLNQLYYKRNDQLERIKNKIEIEETSENFTLESNVCAFFDFGFSFSSMDLNKLQKNFLKPDFEKIVEKIKGFSSDFSISKMGHSYLITVGKRVAQKGGTDVVLPAGIHNFIEIMADGSIKCRIVLFAQNDNYDVDISSFMLISVLFRDIYEIIFGDKIYRCFLEAQKYEKLKVFKQFSPCYNIVSDELEALEINEYLNNHRRKYGNNLIVIGNRFPKNGYYTIDRRYFDEQKIRYNNENLITELFYSKHCNLGFIMSYKKS